MNFHVLTLFPEMMENALNFSIMKRARDAGFIDFNIVNIRDFTADKHGSVDDYPYGGGAGMLMQAQPVYDAYLSVVGNRGHLPTVYLTPQGEPFTQKKAQELSRFPDLIFLCGHYEGIDERVIEKIDPIEISLGDYVLTGGELPTLVLIDAISRLVPGVLHNDDSAETESFSNGLLEYPQYTRPAVWEGMEVPKILLSGDHAKVEKWRLEESKKRTEKRRPDLLST